MSPDQSTYEPFSLDVVRDRKDVVVVVTGELDLISAAVLDREVRQLLASEFDRVTIDLRGIVFLESTGLRTLLCLRKDAERNDRSLILVPGPAQVQRIFELTATGSLFEWQLERDGHPQRAGRPRLELLRGSASTVA